MSILDSASKVVGKVSSVVDTLFDMSPKNFYSIKDFYNFIRKKQNVPMEHKHFAVVPYKEIYTMDGSISPIWDQLFNDGNLAKFAILINKITFGSGGISLNLETGGVETPGGKYTFTKNKTITTSQQGNTIIITFTNTSDPIVQHFIVPWMYQVSRTNNGQYNSSVGQGDLTISSINSVAKAIKSVSTVRGVFSTLLSENSSGGKKYSSQNPFPKLTIDIKFYRMDQICGIVSMMNPTYIYRLTGVYPISFSPHNAQFQVGQSGRGGINRDVTFAYNNFIPIPNATYENILFGNSNVGFAYDTSSPVQLLNNLNSAASDLKKLF